ncbi:putative pentatricopeptide repeat-containing protein At3g05240 [Andrographis paniculata]|uniref:putative pentatricopeptide repeat-containing protein At3g05240 n=1 Tax=Andrographis paniculata TaxID=175694 RepID=UPI0021E998B1|nr:putative pentatricopeptide repeat-containing protein At3g05240 [Andrographis paniculata]
MHSFQIHSIASPSSANIPIPKSQSKITGDSSPHYSPRRREDPFSDALLSLRRCTATGSPKSGSCQHARVLKLGIETDIYIGNSLLNMYSKCGHLKDAHNLFDQMPHRTVVSWTSMMSAYLLAGDAAAAAVLFGRMLDLDDVRPNEYSLAAALQASASIGDADLIGAFHCYAVKFELVSDEFLQKCLIDAYAKSGMFEAAEKLLQKLSSRDVVAWTSVISGCVRRGYGERSLEFFCRMQEDGIFPNEVTMLAVLQACSEIRSRKIMLLILGFVLKGGLCKCDLVLNSLIGMYSKSGYFVEGMLAFSSFCFTNDGRYTSPETMANLVHGCAIFESGEIGKGIHGYVIKHGFLPCVVVENSLINMYVKIGEEYSAMVLFRTMLKRDVISWNTVISGFVKIGRPGDALRLFAELCRKNCNEKISPDFATVLASLEACSELALSPQGRVIHGYVVRTGLLGDVFIQNALIDMYAKSGKVDSAESIFAEMGKRDIGSWNSLVAAYGSNGRATCALKALFRLERSGGVEPDGVTFVNVLTACAHAGVVREGLAVFGSMEGRYGVKPSVEHYGCIVNLLGRAGRVEEAERFIRTMAVNPGPDVWGALLGACVVAGDVGIAERAAKELAILEPDGSAWRVAMANVYARVGRWAAAAEMRAAVAAEKKEGGWSSVEVGGKEMRFVAGDTKCTERVDAYEILSFLKNHMKDGSSIYYDHFSICC